MITTLRKISLAAIAATTALSALAWGQKGHDTVAAIAERHFTAATADSVAAILDGMSPVYWANWLDNASHTPDYAYTKTWHYKNIDAGVPYDSVAPAPTGDAVTAIREQIAVLSSPASSKAQKTLAMKILIHVVGDLHQPMHLGHASDKGGNTVQVRFFNDGTNLHSAWDSRIPNAAHSWTFTEWADQLDRLSADSAAAEAAGNVDDWARQTAAIATDVYNYFPTGSRISYNQIAYWTPTVERQLLRGGLRLARILNAIYEPSDADTPSAF